MAKRIAQSCMIVLLLFGVAILLAAPSSNPETVIKIGYLGIVFGCVGIAGIIAALLHIANR